MELHERIEITELAEHDPVYRALFIEQCKRDVAFWINTCCWTFDPRVRGAKGWMPFLLFPKQTEMVTWMKQCIEDQLDWGVEKSRDTGASWCALAVFVHYWLFTDGFVGIIGSRKEDYIDKTGDPDTLFWKIDSLIQSLPWFMAPAGYRPESPWRAFLKVQNPVNGAVIKGESPNADFGRAGRSTAALLDELASWMYAQAAWGSVGENSASRGAVSTPKGMNFFGRLMNPGKKETEAVKRFRIHWMDDPRHNKPTLDPKTGQTIYKWYESRKARYNYDSAMIAQELDISYKGSVGKMVYGQVRFVRRMKLTYNPQLPLYLAWDYGVGDACAMGWFQWDWRDSRFKMIDYLEANGHAIEWYIPFVTGAVPSGADVDGYSPAEIERIQRHRGWRVDEHYGDPAGAQRNPVTATSVIETLAKYQIYVMTNNMAITFQPRYDATKPLLMKLDVDDEFCEQFLRCIENAKFPDRPEGTNTTSEIKIPVHDWTSHGRSMLEYFAVNQMHLSNPEARVEYERDDQGVIVAREYYDLDDEDAGDPTMTPRGRAGY